MSTIQCVDGAAIVSGFSNLFTLNNAADVARATHAIGRRVVFTPFTDANTAATAVIESTINVNPMGAPTNGSTNSNGLLLVGAFVSLNIAATASDTLFATFTVSARLGATGGTPTVLATQTTKITGGSGNVLIYKPVALPLASTNLVLFPSATLPDLATFLVTKASTGTVVTAATGWSTLITIWQEL